MPADCPTCDAAQERYRERDAAANAERERAMDAANAKRRHAMAAANDEWANAWDAADAERDHILAEHPHHDTEAGP